MNPTQILRDVLSGLMQRYAARVPDVQRITRAMQRDGLIAGPDAIENDHIAFRTLGVPHLGIRSFERIFLALGYTRREPYHFAAKKLDAFWYAPPAEDLPRIFVSELRVPDLSARAREIIARHTAGITADPTQALDLSNAAQVVDFLHRPLWPLPTHADYRALLAESEYAAWVIYNRYYLNHYTISVHNLPAGYDTCADFNRYLKSLGVRLNDAGGEVKASPDGLLLQSSTVAGLIEAEFADGGRHEIAGSYVEFAERRPLPQFAHLPKAMLRREHRREGFEAGNADKIFESTFTSQTRRADAAARTPRIRTALPGPKAAAVLARDAQVMSPSNAHGVPMVASHGQGAWLTDVDGNEFLDLMAGIATTSTGHAHPHVVRAVSEQAARVNHTCAVVFPHDPVTSLAERLVAHAGGGYRVFFGNSGTEGIEAALKFARQHTHRPNFIAFEGGFHGRSAGSLSLTASQAKYRKGYGPMAYPVSHMPYPNPFRPFGGSSPENCGAAVLAHIERAFKTYCPPEDVAGIVIEPILGEGGYIVPPDGFLRDLAALARAHGILLIVDEVQTGAGRTGKFFEHQHAGITPDVIVSAKGIASGYPLSATLIRSEICDWKPGAHGSTYGGNAVSCAASHATLDLIEAGLMDNARVVGAQLIQQLRELQAEFPRIGDVRGRGLMIGVEFVAPGAGEPDADLRDRVQQAAFERGLLVLAAGASTVRMAPPLILSQAEADTAVSVFAEALAAAGAGAV